MNSIEGYIIQNRKPNSINKLFILTSLLIFFSVGVILNMKFAKYISLNGLIIKEQEIFQLKLYLTPYQLKIIKNNDKIIIENKKTKYNINHISENYILSTTNKNYLEVVLDVELDKKEKIVNNIVDTKILESEKTIFYHIKNYLMKGLIE